MEHVPDFKLEKEEHEKFVQLLKSRDCNAWTVLWKDKKLTMYFQKKYFSNWEDLMSETFLKAMRAIDTFRGSSSVFTWVYSISMSLSIDTIRKRERERKYIEENLSNNFKLSNSDVNDVYREIMLKEIKTALAEEHDLEVGENTYKFLTEELDKKHMPSISGKKDGAIAMWKNRTINKLRKRFKL